MDNDLKIKELATELRLNAKWDLTQPVAKLAEYIVQLKGIPQDEATEIAKTMLYSRRKHI